MLKPAADAIDRLGGADECDRDLARRRRGVGVRGSEMADAVAGINVAVASAELQLWFVQHVGFQTASPIVPPAAAVGRPAAGFCGIQTVSSIAASQSSSSSRPKRMRSSLVLNRVSSPCR